MSRAERAGASLAAGHADEAASAAGDCAPSDARCALVLARALLALQRPAEAAARLGPHVAKLGALEPHATVLLGEALLLAGDAAGAIAPLRRASLLDPRGPAGLRAAALLGDSLLAAGHPEEAVSAAAAALAGGGLSSEQRAGLAFTRMVALEQIAERKPAPAGAQRAAAIACRELWLGFPAHPAAERARAEEESFARRIPGGIPAPTGRQRLARASRLLSAGQPAAAVDAAREAVRALSKTDAAEGNYFLARALAAAGDRAQAAPHLQIAWARGGRRYAPPAGMLLARDRARRGQWQGAVRLLDELVRKYPQAAEAAEARLLAARLLEEHGDAEGGQKRLESLAKARGPRAADARWALAWGAFREADEDAPERFRAYAQEAADATERARGLYWAARAGAKDGRALLAQVKDLDPIGYYGALALAASGDADAELPAFPPPPLSALEGGAPALAAAGQVEDQRLVLGRELAALGLCAEATAELDAHLHLRGGTAAALPTLALFERCRRFDRSLTLAQSLLGGALARDRPLLLRAAYPAAYADLVERAARRTRLDPYLLLSVARRESLFRPDAQSGAGAVGLVQLLPKTAARIGAVLGRPAPDAAALADPAVALDLGAWYLSELYGVFGDPAIAAAAYNAGPRAAGKWAKDGAGRALDEWVEEIPYRETRLYVKSVIGAWSAYRLLAGGKTPRLSARVPAPKGGVAF